MIIIFVLLPSSLHYYAMFYVAEALVQRHRLDQRSATELTQTLAIAVLSMQFLWKSVPQDKKKHTLGKHIAWNNLPMVKSFSMYVLHITATLGHRHREQGRRPEWQGVLACPSCGPMARAELPV